MGIGTTNESGATPTRRDTPTMADRKPLRVIAQASQPALGRSLILHVDVRDADGAPVKTLDRDDFTVLELPGGISDLPQPIVTHLGASVPVRAGLYQLLFPSWDAPNRGTIAYHVRVARGANIGVAMTSLYMAPA